MTPLDRAVHDIAAAFDALQIQYAVIGGIANAIWGEPRATIDVDVTVSVDDEDLPRIVPALGRQFGPAVADPLAPVDIIAAAR